MICPCGAKHVRDCRVTCEHGEAAVSRVRLVSVALMVGPPNCRLATLRTLDFADVPDARRRLVEAYAALRMYSGAGVAG